MNEYQKVMLDIIKEFIKVCNEHELVWWADGGTLLGAAREHGFIEWDTDADVIMPREHYDILIDHPEWFEKYFLATNKTQKGWDRKFSKLMDTNTTCIVGDEKSGWAKGIYLDIFPLDEFMGHVADISLGVRPNCIWEREWFETNRLIPFEDIYLSVPEDYDKVLERQYGDWRSPNKEGGSHKNSKVYFSLKKEW